MEPDPINILNFLPFTHATKEQVVVLKAMQDFVSEKK